MPKALERKLKSKARAKGLSKKRANAYIYGTLRKTGWTPNISAKGKISKNIGKRGHASFGKKSFGKGA